MFDLTKRFSIGINIDDPWIYAGTLTPKSIIIPHLLSIRLPVGKALDKIDELAFQKHKHALQNQSACMDCRKAIISLAQNLVSAKIQFVRCWFPWKLFEPNLASKNKLRILLDESYEYWPMDDFVEVLTDHDIGIMPVVACGYQRMLPHGLKVDSDRESYVKRASIHTRLLVRKYKNKIRFWQIENEPNWWKMHTAGGWRSGLSWIDPHDFAYRLLKELNDAVHSEDSNAITIINLEADAKTTKANYFAPLCDLLGLDFYPNYKASSPIDTSIFKKANRVKTELGRKVIISETGYPSGPFFLGYSASKQAKYVSRACSDASDIEAICGIGIWRYRDSAWRSFPFQENHFGLINSMGNPKPAWNSLKNMIRKLT